MPPRHAPPPPRSLRSTLALAFAAVAIAQALLLAAVLGHSLSSRIREDEGRAVQAAARVVAAQMADGLARRAREVAVMAASPTMWRDGLDAERVRQVFARSQAVNPHTAWIGVTDAQGIVRAATDGLLEGVDVSSRPWFIAGRDKAIVGDVHPAKLLAEKLPRGTDGGPQRFVDFAAPIRRDGQLLGVVAMHGSWDWAQATVEALLPALAAQTKLQIFIVDRGGQPIYTPDHAPAAKLGLVMSKSMGRPMVATWADGTSALSAAARVQSSADVADLGWTVVARVPTNEAYAPARDAVLTVVLLGCGSALAAAVAGTQWARHMTRPLRRLARHAGQVAQDQPDARFADSEGPIEVRQLAGALSHMTGRLREERDALEQRVQERTQALADANARLETLSMHDPLTGLLNRRGFDDRAAALLADARRHGTPVSVLVLDIDHFKQVNDRFGHDGGDGVLRELAALLRHRLRGVDLVARFGGEEFTVLLPKTAADGADVVAAQLVARVAEAPMPAVGHITVSCGVTVLDSRAESLAEALSRADAALYHVKRHGRNGWRHARAQPGPAAAPVDERRVAHIPA